MPAPHEYTFCPVYEDFNVNFLRVNSQYALKWSIGNCI